MVNFAKTRERDDKGKFVIPINRSNFDRRKYQKEYYRLNRKKRISQSVEWAKKNKDKRKLVKDKWRSKNKELTNFLCRMYHYRRKGAKGYASLKQISKLYKDYLGLCAYCGLNKATTIDHIIPLIKGGSNNIDNLSPACVSCNSSKGGKLLKEWKPELYE